MFEINIIKRKNNKIKNLIEKYIGDGDLAAYIKILRYCSFIMDYLILDAYLIEVRKRNSNVCFEELDKKVKEGLEWAIRHYNIKNNDYLFISFAIFYIYLGVNIPEWVFNVQTDEYVLDEKKNDILQKLDHEIISHGISNERINKLLKDNINLEEIRKRLSSKPKEVDFATKYSVDYEQIQKVKNGDEQSFIILVENYGDIVESIISRYSHLFDNNKEELIKMKRDGYKAMKLAICKLPSLSYITNIQILGREYWQSYVFAQIIWYVYFFTIVPRLNKNFKIDYLIQENGNTIPDFDKRFGVTQDILEIYNMIYLQQHTYLALKLKRENQDQVNEDLRCWNRALDYLDDKFDINKFDVVKPEKVLKLVDYASKKGHL